MVVIRNSIKTSTDFEVHTINRYKVHLRWPMNYEKEQVLFLLNV